MKRIKILDKRIPVGQIYDNYKIVAPSFFYKDGLFSILENKETGENYLWNPLASSSPNGKTILNYVQIDRDEIVVGSMIDKVVGNFKPGEFNRMLEHKKELSDVMKQNL